MYLAKQRNGWLSWNILKSATIELSGSDQGFSKLMEYNLCCSQHWPGALLQTWFNFIPSMDE